MLAPPRNVDLRGFMSQSADLFFCPRSVCGLTESVQEKQSYHVTGRGGLWGCDMLRIPHCLDSRLTDCGEVVSLTHRPRSALQEHSFSACGTHFC
jgi:hypothetical protein